MLQLQWTSAGMVLNVYWAEECVISLLTNQLIQFAQAYIDFYLFIFTYQNSCEYICILLFNLVQSQIFKNKKLFWTSQFKFSYEKQFTCPDESHIQMNS